MWTDQLFRRENARIDRQKRNFDARHYKEDSIEFSIGYEVFVQDLRCWGKIVKKCREPRFLMKCAKGIFRRTRSHLVRLKSTILDVDSMMDGSTQNQNGVLNRTNDNIVTEEQLSVDVVSTTSYCAIAASPKYAS